MYLRIGLDEASRQLGGPAHVIEGMSAMFMGLAQGVTVPGAEATRPVVRVVYQDTQGRLIFLDQQRIRPGQTLPATTPLSWVSGRHGMWLHGEVGAEILRTYRSPGALTGRSRPPRRRGAPRTRRTSSSAANGFRMKAMRAR